ncbi:signal transduction histidine kinase [Streptomyces sp. TLI_235]|nr:ATP-binding protein [Streptomyces sp. TLI_235]PBC69638.1 signal transduction histidine kinase [Streptomyces sp. TLI_235]
MLGRGRSPSGPGRAVSTVGWALPPAVLAACTAAATSVVSEAARLPLGLSGGAATAAVALVSAETVRRGRALALARAHSAAQESSFSQRLALHRSAALSLARVLLPQAVARLQQGYPAEEVLHRAAYPAGLDPEFKAAQEAVLRLVVEAVQAEEELRDSAQRAFVNVARRVQAIVHQQASDVREMEDRHGEDNEVFADLLHLDHGTALIGRLADSIAVLGGARPGRQWPQDLALFSVLRGAMSRILYYRRVDLHSVVDLAVVGAAVEPLIHALAELLDNATRYSPPQTRVHLTAVEVQSGVAIEIEDGGVGLSDEAGARAEQVLSDASLGLDLNDLGESPRLGLSVVGRLAQTNGFQVSLRPSAYGGVRAVVIIPQELVTATPASASILSPEPVPQPLPMRSAPARPAAPAAPHQAAVERNERGLPQRRRRTSAAPTLHDMEATPAAAAPPVQPGLWLSDFLHGGAIDGTAPTASFGNHDELSGKGGHG